MKKDLKTLVAERTAQDTEAATFTAKKKPNRKPKAYIRLDVDGYENYIANVAAENGVSQTKYLRYLIKQDMENNPRGKQLNKPKDKSKFDDV